MQPRAELVDRVPIARHDALHEALDLRDQLGDLTDEHRDDDEDDAGEHREHDGEGDEQRRPAGQTLALEPRHGGVEAEGEEERRADVEQDRRERLHARDDQDSDADAEGRDQRGAERVVKLHAYSSEMAGSMLRLRTLATATGCDAGVDSSRSMHRTSSLVWNVECVLPDPAAECGEV